MKKILITVACLLALGTANANKITIVNISTNSFSFSFRGLAVPPSGNTYFESAQIPFPPGTTIYNSPADVPGLSFLPATADFDYIKGNCTSCTGVTNASVGYSILMPLLPLNISIPSSFSISWTQASPTADIIVFITN